MVRHPSRLLACASLTLLMAGCGSGRPARGALATSRPVAAAGGDGGDGGDGGLAASTDAASASTAAQVDPVLARCLAAGDLRAVVTLASSRADCSGIGHEHLVFTVDADSGAGMGMAGLDRAYLSCGLGSRCPELEGATGFPVAEDGSSWIVTLRPDARPARTVYCVPLPATQAVVTCAVRVDSVAHGRRLLSAARDAR